MSEGTRSNRGILQLQLSPQEAEGHLRQMPGTRKWPCDDTASGYKTGPKPWEEVLIDRGWRQAADSDTRQAWEDGAAPSPGKPEAASRQGASQQPLLGSDFFPKNLKQTHFWLLNDLLCNICHNSHRKPVYPGTRE